MARQALRKRIYHFFSEGVWVWGRRSAATLLVVEYAVHAGSPHTWSCSIPAGKWGAGIRRFGAGTGFPQENGALESAGSGLEPDSRKKMGRWSPQVRGWSRVPARKWGAGIRRFGAGTGFPQEDGALESSGWGLEPGSRKKMGRWNPQVRGWNRIPASTWGAGIRRFGAGARFPQENGALEYSGYEI
jgi:hypothetical protein